MLEISDQNLVMRTLTGETHAYSDLVQRYQGSVFNICYRLLGERREAEDLTQEAFIRAYQRLQTFDTQREFGPWMRRLTVNLCYNQLQKRRFEEMPLEEETTLNMWQIPRETNQPEKVFLQAERHSSLRAALLELNTQYRVVIELRHFHDLSYEEISTELNLPINTVKSHIFRARKQLAQILVNASET
ncbi:MAG: sigma-70 family RNA polymerase sigma factor [Anaerolineaceae bacterium]|nr:sigma-70 family RNA polymerase sigma factor [Anaerolineaceae bacterium]